MVMVLEIELVLRLVLAAALGSIIGLDREWNYKPAGLRTHVLVCMGATLFATTAIGIGSSDTDIARIAAGIVTGIGFLGAGTIFRENDKVRGLTTAADLWVLAAIGISTGIGQYLLAIASTILVLIILVTGRHIDSFIEKRRKGTGKDKFD